MRFAVKHLERGDYWAATARNRWGSVAIARWFPTREIAEHAAERELPAPRFTYCVVQIDHLVRLNWQGEAHA